ncbi:MAG: hypothetical protein ABIW76_13480 [Fibrobacteria bacterium]
MSRPSPSLMVVFITALAAFLPMHAQVVVDPPVPDWSLNPGAVNAGQVFSLSALSYKYTCANTFANQSVVVNDGRIDLSFTSAVDTAVLCAAIVKPFGPTFNMPALKAGKYPVYMNLLLPCHVTQPMCKAAVRVEEAGTLVVTEEDKVTYVIDPTQVEADQDFILNLLSPQFGCNIDYLRTASRVQDGKITLTYLDKPNPLVRCAPSKPMYGPAYKIRGLKAGSYEVWAERLPACVEEGCKMASIPELVAKLVVMPTNAVRKGWFFNPREVKSGIPLSLKVVNNEYGNCNTEFDHTSLVVQDNGIHVSFVIVNHPERVCVMDLHPHGPTFQMDALKPGRYPLYVSVMPACIYTEPRCLIGMPDTILVASDTLIVSQSVTLGGLPVLSGSGPSAAWTDGALRLLLPDGAQGTWRADVLNLSGRRLFSAAVTAGSSKRSALSGMLKPNRGIILVRLVSPALETHTLRVPVPD